MQCCLTPENVADQWMVENFQLLAPLQQLTEHGCRVVSLTEVGKIYF